MGMRNMAMYHLWAGDKSRQILRDLTEEEFEKDLGPVLGSIREKVIHTISALLRCFSLLKIELSYFDKSLQETYQKITLYSFDELLDCWEDLDKCLVEGVKHHSKGTVEIPRRDGDSFCMMRNDFYVQYITHTIYHRGQLNYCLKALNKPRIDADYLYYFDELDTSLDEKM
ncbi:MAG: DinB family protein [Candidatus Hodarchaeales archaeon]|jgi:uncharacterized damage-inducible protein DinB